MLLTFFIEVEYWNGRFGAFTSVYRRDLWWLWKISLLFLSGIMQRTLALNPICRNRDTLAIWVNCVVAFSLTIFWNYLLILNFICIDPFIFDLLISFASKSSCRWAKYLISHSTISAFRMIHRATTSIIFINDLVPAGRFKIRNWWIAHTCLSQDITQVIFLLGALWRGS